MLSGCMYYRPAEGYTKEHQSYEAALEYAKNIDPDAVVYEEYVDTEDEYGHMYREWDAVIKGVECHVASRWVWVWNEGALAGEFCKTFYRMDTDYDFCIMKSIVLEMEPEWMPEETIGNRYPLNDIIALHKAFVKRMTDDELEAVYARAKEINDLYIQNSVEMELRLVVETQLGRSDAYLTEFSEDGKREFFEEYHELIQ